MELSLQALPDQASAGMIDVADGVFARDFNETLVHQSVVAYMAHARSGSKAQKNRSDVSGSTAKPWRQKGTGRARAGNTRSPIWRSGGVTFAARPRNYSQKMNKKMYRAALRSILSELVRQERLVAVEDFSVSAPKTREVVAKLKPFEQAKTLIVTAEEDANLALATRNLFYVDLATAQSVNPLSLVWADKVIITTGALKQLEERLQ